MDFYLVTYDIPHNKPRHKLANLLQDYGQRVQYSVFEIWLEPKHFKQLQARIHVLLDEEPGQVRFYRLCANCQKTVELIGGGEPPELPGVFIF